LIDKNELLKLLPKLIREDDEIKGAIITALSGVVATKEDIASLIEHSNRRFEEIQKRFEEIEKRFEEIHRRFEEAAKERRDMQDSMVVLRETVGEVLQKVDRIETNVKNGNKEIMNYLKEQFETEE